MEAPGSDGASTPLDRTLTALLRQGRVFQGRRRPHNWSEMERFGSGSQHFAIGTRGEPFLHHIGQDGDGSSLCRLPCAERKISDTELGSRLEGYRRHLRGLLAILVDFTMNPRHAF